MPTILRLDAVKRRIGLGRSQIYDLANRGEFPKPVKLSQRASGWLENEIDAWVNARVAARDAGFRR